MPNPEPAPCDATLVERARGGDVGAFEELIHRYFNLVHSIAYLRMRHREMAEDLAQEVFLRAFLHLDTIRDPARFSAWIGQVTRNLAHHWQTKRQRVSRLVAMVPLEPLADKIPDNQQKGVRETMEDQQKVRAVRDAIFMLPASEAEVVLLRYSEDLKPPEIARRLDIHPTTVRRRLKSALAAMKSLLEPVFHEVAPELLASREAAVRTVRLLDAVAVLSPVERAALSRLSAGVTDKGVWVTEMSLRSLYYWAYRTTPGRILMPDDIAEKHYDISLETYQDTFDALYPAMQDLLARETGLAARWETSERDVHVLTVADDGPTGLREPGPRPKGWAAYTKLDSTGGSECLNSDLSCLVIQLEENLPLPVVDETGLEGQYDWGMTWPTGAKEEAIVAAVGDQMGLRLTHARRRVKMLILGGGK